MTTLTAQYSLTTGATKYLMTLGNLNSSNQTQPDIALADNKGYVTVLLNSGGGSGTFQVLSAKPASSASFSSIAVGDLNGDGIAVS